MPAVVRFPEAEFVLVAAARWIVEERIPSRYQSPAFSDVGVASELATSLGTLA